MPQLSAKRVQFHAGDRVRIVRDAPECPWWTSFMNQFVGGEYTVHDADNAHFQVTVSTCVFPVECAELYTPLFHTGEEG